MTTTPRYGLLHLEETQQNPEAAHNEALDILTTVVGLYVKNRTTSNGASLAIVEGEAYIVPVGASGADWENHIGDVAVGLNGGWTFITPENGTWFYIEDEGCGGIYVNGYLIRNPSPRFVGRRDAILLLTSTEGELPWDVSLVKDGYFAHTAASAGIAPAGAGYHQISADVAIERVPGSPASTGNTVVIMQLKVNSALVTGGVAYATISDTSTPVTLHMSRVFNVGTAGHNITLTLQVVSGSAELQVAAIGTGVIITKP